jgi:hypothetical protein
MGSFKILCVGKDAKTVKGQKQGILTGILYLAPHTTSNTGINLCPKATNGCKKACLYTAGRAAFQPNVIPGRIRKTKLLVEHTAHFLRLLRKDLAALVRKAERENLLPAVRLNGTSDIAWEKTGIMDLYPEIQFYDYTKLDLEDRLVLPNYHLTYSVTESRSSWRQAKKYLDAGYGAAVVFENRPMIDEVLADGYDGYPVIDGDGSDVRFYDLPGSVVALKAKGQAKKDTTGFVRRIGRAQRMAA